MPRSAGAAAPRVLLFHASGGETIANRMERELALLGIDVERRSRLEGLPEQALEAGDASALALVGSTAGRVRLWVRRSDARVAPLDVPEHASDSDELVALRATELLRGRLLPVGPVPAPGGVESRPAAAAEADASADADASAAKEPVREVTPAPSERRAVIALGPALFFGGATSPALGVMASATLHWEFGLTLGAAGVAPIQQAEARVQSRSFAVREFWLGALAGYAIDLPAPWLADATAFAGARIASHTSETPAPLDAPDGTEAGALLGLLASGGVALTTALSLRARAGLFTSLPELELPATVRSNPNAAPQSSAQVEPLGLGVRWLAALSLEARF
jgi:hypothetical protein